MSVYIGDLREKYYGTEVWVEDEVICGEPTDFIITVWAHANTPSDRELAKHGITRERWDSADLASRDTVDTIYGHFESVQSLKIAEAICEAIQNVAKENP